MSRRDFVDQLVELVRCRAEVAAYLQEAIEEASRQVADQVARAITTERHLAGARDAFGRFEQAVKKGRRHA